MASPRQLVVQAPPGGGWLRALEGSERCEAWRTVQVTTTAPVEVELSWTNALGSTVPLLFSAARVAQVCVVGSRWGVRVRNPSASGPPVRVSTSILHERTDCSVVLEQPAPASPSPTPALHELPAWATDLRVDTTTQNGAQAGLLVELLDTAGTVRASVAGVAQPLWIPLGLAHQVRVTCEAPHRLVWRLSPL